MRRNSGGGFFHRMTARAGLALGLIRSIPGVLRETPEGPTEPIDPTTRFEGGDLNPKAVFLTGVGLLAGLWLIVLLIYPIFAYLKHERAEGGPAVSAAVHERIPLPPEPRIQANPRRDLREFLARENNELGSYHWIDRAHNVVAIPIERAIQVIAQRGIPPQPAPPGLTYFDPRAGTRVTGFEGKVEPEPR